MKITPLKSFSVLAVVLSLGGLSLAGCGGSNIPSVTSGGSSTPRPGGTPTGTPTGVPTATPTATPTTTPTATPPPGTGNGTLAAYFGTVPATANLTYRDTSTITSTDPLTGQPTTNTNTTTFTTGGGNPFASGNTGQRTQVSLPTATGNVTVTRQENLDDDGSLTGYTYYTLDSNAYTLYGQDDLDGQKRTTGRTRYTPAARFTLDLRPGQTTSQAVRVTQTTIDPDDNTTTEMIYDQSFTLTFVGVESVTVPAGTYTNAARVNYNFTFNRPAQGETPAFSTTATSVSWYAPSVGLAKSTLDSNSTIPFPNPVTGETQNLTTRIQSNTELIAVAGN